MPVNFLEILHSLKHIEIDNLSVSLAIVIERKSNPIKYVRVNDELESKLKQIIITKINNSTSVEEYSFDCPEPEGDHVIGTISENTPFINIYDNLINLNPDVDIVSGMDEIYKARAYLIILRNIEGIQIIAYKILPENWILKKAHGVMSILYSEDTFVPLNDDKVFSLSNTIDFIYFNDTLFIMSKKEFERGLKFREGMITHAEMLFVELEQLGTFKNIELLKNRVGQNLRYLRKIATIKNLGYYRDVQFLIKMKNLCTAKNWNILFDNYNIVFTDDTIEDILILLQNKRLLSELNDRNYDVSSAKQVN